MKKQPSPQPPANDGMIAKTVAVSDYEWAQRSLPWCFRQPLPSGRDLGDGRRSPFIDRRVAMLIDRVNLAGKRVLEPGCCEGHITVGLCSQGAKVTAFDARLPNATKTFVRTSLAGYSPRVLVADADDMRKFGEFDVVCNCGVFYHLRRPVEHLRQMARITGTLLLDTHVALPDREIVEHEGVAGHWWAETTDLWAGMTAESFWLTRESLLATAKEAGFSRVDQLDWLENANGCGPRGVWLLRR